MHINWYTNKPFFTHNLISASGQQVAWNNKKTGTESDVLYQLYN